MTSSLAFDFVENFELLMRDIYGLLRDQGILVFSMSHPMATAWDGTYDKYTRSENGERLYANIGHYSVEGLRCVKWVVDGCELYHRTFATLVNGMIRAGFVIEECQESKVPKELMEKYGNVFGGVVHRPDFVFFRCRKG